MPQPLGAHELAEAEALLLPPLVFEAKVDTLRRTWWLPHFGQTVSVAATVVAATEVAEADTRTSSSKVLWQSVHWNS
jgi:hypothetical protein